MYAGPASHVDREEYLLGKRIDRQIDPLLASEEKEKEVRRREGGTWRGWVMMFFWWQALATGPGALFSAPDAANSATDLAVKVREDPLFMIRKKEEEAKKQLASNPIKMKHLQEASLYIHDCTYTCRLRQKSSSHNLFCLPQLLAKERHSKHHHKSKKKKKQRERSRSPHRYSGGVCGCGCVCCESCGSAHCRKSSKGKRR